MKLHNQAVERSRLEKRKERRTTENMVMKSYKSLAFIFFLLLLVASGDGVNNSVEARSKGPRLCDSRSRTFKGLCVSDRNCANVCRHERFFGGHCRGLRQRCFCTQPCKY